MKKKLSKKAAIALYILSGVIVVGLIVGNYYANSYAHIISTYFGHSTSKVVSNEENADKEYYKSDFESKEDLTAHGEKIVQELVEEGIVLLKNEDDVLPLTEAKKISLLGQNSVDFVYGGGGAGSVDTSVAPDLLDAFKKSGFDVNPKLWDFYEKGAGSKYRKATPDVYGEGDFAVNEVPKSVYTKDVIDSFADYGEAGIVVLGRSGGESSDLSTDKLESGSHYLQIDQDERDLLALAQENFDEVIVIINSLNPMELDFLDEYDIKACLWVGAVGKTGIYAVSDVLNGTVNPSGRLVDTHAYDAMSAPAMANFGDYKFTNSDVDRGAEYMVYGEGIYVGYRYYETRYEDVVLGKETQKNYDYATQVHYPFGYGLSYTNFEYSDYALNEKDDLYEVTVKVTNTGKVAGKEVVQLYMQSPYTKYDIDNQIEKSAVELVGFAKTADIEPGQAEEVVIEVPKEEMKTYDANGHGTYIVDAGDYYFATGKDVHASLNNILAAKGLTKADGMTTDGNQDLAAKVTVDKLDVTTYAVAESTENEIENQFQDADIKYYDQDFVYLSRNDWEGTWPKTYQEGAFEAPAELLADLEISTTENPDAKMPKTETVNPEHGELTASSFIGLDYDNEMWDALLDQLSLAEMIELVRMGGYATVGVPSIGLPPTINKDGPAGISDTLVGGDTDGMAFPSQIVLASTWNLDAIQEMGAAVGEDSLKSGVAGWYAPGVNTHRVPFGGRNFEYYSEDSFLSGKMGAREVAGVNEKGAFVFVKHFALNDTDTNRIGGSMFANEQSIRELYLKPFETTVREGKATGAMASMNRIGARWTGGHAGLMTETLRNEWGFEGTVVTDQASFDAFMYEDIHEGLEAGTNLWLNTDASLWKIAEKDVTPTLAQQLRESAHSIIYTVVNSNAMNGIASGDKVVAITPTWQYWLLAANVVVGLIVVVVLVMVTRNMMSQRKK